MKIKHGLAIFMVILLEGYVVLSSELLAIRQTIPFIGSGTDTVSIIIAAVLMPLAFGYQAAGRFKPGFHNGQYQSVRNKLIFNLQASSVILLIGLSYPLMNVFFYSMMGAGLENRLLLVTIYSAIFLVIPVYLLGQTIPLCSNYFSKKRLAKITGHILFFSTMGSFLGAVFSTLVLMSTIGVHYTVALNFIILFFLVVVLSKKKLSEKTIFSFAVMCAALYLNSDKMMEHFSIVENNKYNTIAVVEDEETGFRHLSLNNNDSSKYNDAGEKHEYIEFIERTVIDSIPEEAAAKNVLVIGAGAFTFGFEDTKNKYDYIDIDGSLERIAEEYVLKAELKENQTFHAVPARAYLSTTDKKYDVILLDAYFGDRTIPEHLVTREFFDHVRSKLSDDGVMAANFIIAPHFISRFSQKIDNTMRAAFPYVSRISIDEEYDIWSEKYSETANVIYLYKNSASYLPHDQIYTDNLNTIFFDKPQER